MNRDAIIARIRSKIDEISEPDDLQLVDDVFSVIDSNLEDSANTFLHKAPLWLTKSHRLPLENHELLPKNLGGRIDLPDDFLKLHSFQLKGWNAPVSIAFYGENHPYYQYRKNPYLTGIHRPMVAIISVPTSQGGGMGAQDEPTKRVLEYFPGSDSPQVERRLYVKRVDKEDNPISEQPDRLLDGLFWQAAADFFIIVQQPNNASAALSKLDEFLSLNVTHFTGNPETKSSD